MKEGKRKSQDPVSAYVLIRTVLGDSFRVKDAILGKGKEGKECQSKAQKYEVKVLEAYVVTGTYDVIAEVSAASNDRLVRFVADALHPLLKHSPEGSTETAIRVDM